CGGPSSPGNARSRWPEPAQGHRRDTSQPPPADENTSRPCSRDGRPRQNSIRSGATTDPAPLGGQGTSAPEKRSASAAWRTSSSAREETGSLCRDAQALNCDPRGRIAKYSADTDADVREAGPSILTCRCSSGQWNSRLARGFAAR